MDIKKEDGGVYGPSTLAAFASCLHFQEKKSKINNIFICCSLVVFFLVSFCFHFAFSSSKFIIVTKKNKVIGNIKDLQHFFRFKWWKLNY